MTEPATYKNWQEHQATRQTFGEARIGNSKVSYARAMWEIRGLCSKLIDTIGALPTAGASKHNTAEMARLQALAVTAVETASMWSDKLGAYCEEYGTETAKNALTPKHQRTPEPGDIL